MEIQSAFCDGDGITIALSSDVGEWDNVVLCLEPAGGGAEIRIPHAGYNRSANPVTVTFDVELFNLDCTIAKLSLELMRGSGTESLPRSAENVSLHIEDDADYEARFMLTNKQVGVPESRTGNSLLDFFTAFQVQRNDRISRHFKCAASVIMAYKAIDLQSDKLRNLSLASLNSNIAAIGECDLHWHPRKNREHLLFSMLCARWHLELAAGDAKGMEATLDEVYRRSFDLHNYFTPAFPINTSLLVYSFILAGRSHREKAAAIVAHMHDVYKYAVISSDVLRTTLFSELAKSHQCVSAAHHVLTRFKPDKADNLARQVLAISYRGRENREVAIAALAGMVRPG